MKKIDFGEGNELIALFMGATFNPNWRFLNDNKYDVKPTWEYAMDNRPTKYSTMYWGASQMEYHLTWDWIMPVVEKIESMGLHFNTQKNESWIDWLGVENENLEFLQQYDNEKFEANKGESKIDSVYKTVVQFIKSYNAYQKEKKN